MGRLILQMMISVDGMVSDSAGNLNWIANDKALAQDHLQRAQEAALVIEGSGGALEMSGYWMAAENDDNADQAMKDIGRAMNEVPKIVYSHQDLSINWRNTTVRVIDNDADWLTDVQRLKQETDGAIVTYGGVRFARSLLQHNLLDEIHLDVCPIILGTGQPLFIGPLERAQLKLKDTQSYDSGAIMLHYLIND